MSILQLQGVHRTQRTARVLRVELREPAAILKDGGVLLDQRWPGQVVFVVPDSHVALEL